MNYYTDSSCSGDATYTTITEYAGCMATNGHVIDTQRNSGTEVASTINGKPSAEIKELPVSIQSVRDAAHAKTQEATASALA